MSADHYPPRTQVRVVVPRDPWTGQIGVVHSTYNDGGDMIHRVRFPGGAGAEYAADELAALTAHGQD